MIVIVYGAGFLIWLLWKICALTPVKAVFDHLVLYVPGVGKAVRHLNMARVVMAFKSLYGAGVDPRTSWKASAQLCGNAALKRKFFRGLLAIEQGESLESAFARTRLFAPKMMGLIAAGEKGGDLNSAFNRIFIFYQKERDMILRFYTRLAAGLLFIFVVVFVLLSLFRFYMDLFDKITF